MFLGKKISLLEKAIISEDKETLNSDSFWKENKIVNFLHLILLLERMDNGKWERTKIFGLPISFFVTKLWLFI